MISKTSAMIDGRLLQDAAQMKLIMLSALHLIAETWRLITPATINNSSNDDSAVEITEDE
jgi:hypothetical protein